MAALTLKVIQLTFTILRKPLRIHFMSNFVSIASKALGFLYVYKTYKLKKLYPDDAVSNKSILVMMTGHIGNVIMDIEFVLELRKLFKIEDGWKIDILCTKRLWSTCNLLADMSDYNWVDVDYVDATSGTDFPTTYRIVKALKGREYEKVIVTLPDNAPLANYIVATLRSNESIAAFNDIPGKKGARWYFERAYTLPIKVNVDVHETVRLRAILRHLGGENYKIRIHPIPKLCSFSGPSDEYVTITIDSMSTERRWNGSNFAELANLIIDRLGYRVCFTGGKAGEAIYRDIYPHIEKPERITNYVAKTSIEEWVELLRGAVFHVGVDSGSLHVAASVGTPSFCLTGWWDGTRCFPYVTEEQTFDCVDPVCIYGINRKDLSCYACKARNGRSGVGNDECYRDCRSGKPCHCVSSIVPLDVLNTIIESGWGHEQ